eukprot:g27035.t1
MPYQSDGNARPMHYSAFSTFSTQQPVNVKPPPVRATPTSAFAPTTVGKRVRD